MADLRWRVVWLAAGWGLVVAILVLSLMPAPPQPIAFRGVDKLEHLFAYAVLMGWFVQLYQRPRVRNRYAAGFILMGVAVEYLQGLGGVRFFEWWDMAANTTGVLLGLLLGATPAARLLAGIERKLLS